MRPVIEMKQASLARIRRALPAVHPFMNSRVLLVLAFTIPFVPAPSCTGPEARAQVSSDRTSAPAAAPAIGWEKWSDDLFERAKKENRLVILDLEAVWCHWCHVMEETTYKIGRAHV